MYHVFERRCRLRLYLLAVLTALGLTGCDWIWTGDSQNVDVIVSPPLSGTGGNVGGGASLNFACQRSACSDAGCSAIRCSWQDGLSHDLCAEADGFGQVCEAHVSPGEIDPEVSGSPRNWSVTLEDGGQVIAGPVTVATDS
jgi:hypothetical protein